MRRPQNSFWTLPRPPKSPLGPQKLKNDPNIESKSNVRIEGCIENESCSTTWVFEPYSDHKTSRLEPQKDKNDPKIKSNSNVRIQGIIENESCSTTWVDPKTIFESHIEPQISPSVPKKNPIGPQKVKQPQNQVKIKHHNWRKQLKWRLLHYMSRPQNNLNLTPSLPKSQKNYL